uniref:Uncharacterized protein n=1 Tax=Timema cristinae TaxID=61476 RepID=A0A7R9H5N6_TIMCR|nr:unnamed protein product [Timema cristinae]
MVCQLYLSSYLLPAAQCDFQMTAQEKGLLNSISYAGQYVGDYGTLREAYIIQTRIKHLASKRRWSTLGLLSTLHNDGSLRSGLAPPRVSGFFDAECEKEQWANAEKLQIHTEPHVSEKHIDEDDSDAAERTEKEQV